MLNAEWRARINMYLKSVTECFYKELRKIDFEISKGSAENLAEAEKGHYEPISKGDPWGDKWEYSWFRGKVELPAEAEGKRIVLNLNFGNEASLYINGEPFGTRRADWVRAAHHLYSDQTISKEAKPGEAYEIMAEAFGGHYFFATSGCGTGPIVNHELLSPNNYKRPVMGDNSFGIWNEDAYKFYLDMSMLYDIFQNCDKNSLRAAKIAEGLKACTFILDLEADEETRNKSFVKARECLKPLMECQNGSTAPVLYGFGHAHIDVCWLWDLKETEKKCLRTFAAQIRLMDEYPEYKFLQSQPALYEITKRLYPGLYEKIKEKIKTGQWIAEGGMWVEPDTNVPSGESLIRQFLYGKKYFAEEFGVDSKMLWLPDVFGYSAALPQIMLGCGIDYFATCKIFWNYNDGEEFPYNRFMWEGLDGSRVFASVQKNYNNLTTAAATIDSWNTRRQKDDMDGFLYPFGYGDGGGGATRDHIENAVRQKDLEGTPKMRFASPGEYYEDSSRTQPKNVYTGELYFPCHRGTYTSQSKTKKLNRLVEVSFHELEFALSISMLSGKGFNKTELDNNWRAFLTNQFHDILPGSSIEKVNVEAVDSMSKVLNANKEAFLKTLENISDKEQPKQSVLNTMSWDRTSVIKIENAAGKDFYVNGKKAETQIIGENLLAKVETKSMSFSPIELKSQEAADNTETKAVKIHMHNNAAVMENSVMIAVVNRNAEVIRLYDKENDRELAVSPLNKFRMFRDIPRVFDAWDIDCMAEEDEISVDAPGTVEVLYDGALEGRISVKRMLNNSMLTQEIYMRENDPKLYFDTKIDWNEEHKLLKASFPSAVKGDCAIDEIQFGHVKRPNQRSRAYDKERFEVSNHKWAAVCEEGYGVGLLNDCKYGISHLDNCLDLTLMKAGLCPDPRGEKGVHEMKYAFVFFGGSFYESEIVKMGYEFNYPVKLTDCAAFCGSLFNTDSDNVIIETVKPSEDEKGITVRLYEAKRVRTKCLLKAGFDYKTAVLTDMLENPVSEPFSSTEINLTFKPFEIKTIKFLLQ